jgi:uncharacterized protein (TIGR02996 family)
MSQNASLLQAILDDPDDDAVRLIYADWLDEHDDPLGEFIRVQYALVQLDPDDLRRPQLAERERELLLAHGEAWSAPVRELLPGARSYPPRPRYAFHRGFVDEVDLNGREWETLGEELCRRSPIQRLFLHFELPAYSGGESTPTGFGLRDFLQTPRVGQIRMLHLSSLLRERDAAALATGTAITSLRELSFELLPFESVKAVQDFAAAPCLRGLEVLRVGSVVLASDSNWYYPRESHRTDTFLQTLLDAGLPRLRRLVLLNTSLGEVGAAALARTALPALRSLVVQGALEPAGSLELLAQGSWPALEELDLRGNRLAAEHAALLAASPLAGSVRRLDLGNNRLGDAGAETLARWPGGRLEALDLGANRITAAGLAALCRAPALAGLRTLDLRANNFTAADLPLLPAEIDLPSLTTLRLSYNKLSDAELAFLLGRLPASIRALDLSWNALTDRGVRTLAASEAAAGLESLDLGYNQIGDVGITALAAAPALRRLATLSLSTNRLGDAAVAALAAAPHLGRLTTLNLGYNAIGPAGLAALAASPLLRRLEALNLVGNNVTAAQLAELRRDFRGHLGGS